MTLLHSASRTLVLSGLLLVVAMIPVACGSIGIDLSPEGSGVFEGKSEGSEEEEKEPTKQEDDTSQEASGGQVGEEDASSGGENGLDDDFIDDFDSRGGARSFDGYGGEWSGDRNTQCSRGCACDGDEECSLYCDTGDQPCRPECREGSVCYTYAEEAREVIISCTHGSTCYAKEPYSESVKFTCAGGGDCHVSCGESSECSLSCTGTGTCSLDCGDADDCSLECKDLMNCQLIGSEDLSCDEAETVECDGGSQCKSNCDF